MEFHWFEGMNKYFQNLKQEGMTTNFLALTTGYLKPLWRKTTDGY